jgi:hypothetical protein
MAEPAHLECPDYCCPLLIERYNSKYKDLFICDAAQARSPLLGLQAPFSCFVLLPEPAFDPFLIAQGSPGLSGFIDTILAEQQEGTIEG